MIAGAGSERGGVRWRQATALALFALLLLPVSYRAGASLPHGHALIQLLIETGQDIPVHHHGVDQPHDDGSGEVAGSPAGAPAIQIVASTALLPLVLLALAFPALRASLRLTSDAKRTGRSLAPVPPPPQPRTGLSTSP